MNGQIKIDTRLVEITKAEAMAAKSDPRGIWYGPGVSKGVEIVFGKELPVTVFNEMNHSIQELDNIFGTQPTFRGEGGQSETATGRAILREQSFSRLDELIDLVDTIHLQLYQWMFQMIKVRYTERHLIKTVGLETAQRVIELTRNNINDGVEIQIIPGQIIPQDRLFKSERAKEEVIAGVIDPLTYFEETERDNPQELAKRVVKFKLNPLSILDMDEQDMADLQKGQGQMPGEPQKASQLAEIRRQAEELTKSPEFQALPPDQQEQAIKQIEDQVNKLIKTNK